jgi:hypothetical protein
MEALSMIVRILWVSVLEEKNYDGGRRGGEARPFSNHTTAEFSREGAEVGKVVVFKGHGLGRL